MKTLIYVVLLKHTGADLSFSFMIIYFDFPLSRSYDKSGNLLFFILLILQISCTSNLITQLPLTGTFQPAVPQIECCMTLT